MSAGPAATPPHVSTLPRWTLYAGMTLHVACAAGTYILGKPTATWFGDAGALTLARSMLASLLCLSLTGWAVPVPRFSPREWLEVAGLGLLLVPLNQYLFLRGLHDTVGSHAALIYATTPAGVMVAGAAIERRRPPAAWLAGVALALAGVVLVLEPWEKDAAHRDIQRGDLAIAAGLVVWVAYTLWAKRLARRSDPRTVTVWTLVLGTAFLVPFAWGPLARTDMTEMPADVWLGLAWLAAITSTLMMLLWNGMLKRLDAVQVAICANAQPVATAALSATLASAGWIHADQRLGAAFWAGTALVLGGVALVQFRATAGEARGPSPTPE